MKKSWLKIIKQVVYDGVFFDFSKIISIFAFISRCIEIMQIVSVSECTDIVFITVMSCLYASSFCPMGERCVFA